MDIIINFCVFLHQVSNYRSMTSSGEEGATYCCCSWKRLPRALKWAIIGCCVVMLASFIATLYIFTKHGADGFSPHGSGQWRQLVAARRITLLVGFFAFSTFHGSFEWCLQSTIDACVNTGNFRGAMLEKRQMTELWPMGKTKKRLPDVKFSLLPFVSFFSFFLGARREGILHKEH